MSLYYSNETDSWEVPEIDPAIDSLEDPRVWDQANEKFKMSDEELDEINMLISECFWGAKVPGGKE